MIVKMHFSSINLKKCREGQHNKQKVNQAKIHIQMSGDECQNLRIKLFFRYRLFVSMHKNCK